MDCAYRRKPSRMKIGSGEGESSEWPAEELQAWTCERRVERSVEGMAGGGVLGFWASLEWRSGWEGG
jgi:hypothetical protein